MSVLLTAAAVFAADAHGNQVRKELNEPYIIHPLRVGKLAAGLTDSDEFIAACYLHDVVEDTKVPLATIEAVFPERTALLVKVMTKWWESGHASSVVEANKDAYYKQLIETPGGALLKLLDRIDNLYDFMRMARLSPKNHKWARKYYEKTCREFPLILKYVLTDENFYLTAETRERAGKWFSVALSALEVSL